MRESNDDTHKLTQALRSTFELNFKKKLNESKHSRGKTNGVFHLQPTTTTTTTSYHQCHHFFLCPSFDSSLFLQSPSTHTHTFKHLLKMPHQTSRRHNTDRHTHTHTYTQINKVKQNQSIIEKKIEIDHNQVHILFWKQNWCKKILIVSIFRQFSFLCSDKANKKRSLIW